jgi:2-oxoglutarate dehydrogenase E1 component
LPVVPDHEVTDAKRILIASGKVGHDLKAERRKHKDSNTAILFLDQLYPLPRPEYTAFAAHPNAREVVWMQEEPRNLGPFFYVMPRLTQLAQERGLVLRSVKRSSSASPATGSAKAHELEQKTLVSLAFITSSAS